MSMRIGFGLRMTDNKGAGGGGAPAFEGLVATHGTQPFSFYNFNFQMCNRTYHVATEDITSLKLIFSNSIGYGDPTGSDATITASIEYPENTFTQVEFGGVAQGTIPDGGFVTSDAVAVTIPAGTPFWVRNYYTNPSGLPCARLTNLSDQRGFTGEAIIFGVSDVPDLTMGGDIVNQLNENIYGPLAIVGQTTKRCVFVLGDSLTSGWNAFDGIVNSTEDGILTPSLFPTRAFSVSGNFGQTAAAFASHDFAFAYLMPYVTDVFYGLGINDLRAGATAEDVMASVEAARALFAGKNFYGITITPETTSTDDWATTVNQTPTAMNPERIAYNTTVRAGPAGWAGVFDMASILESGLNSGLWKAPGWTDDGLHGLQLAYQSIIDSGIVTI